MIKAFIDSDVLLDFLLEREPFATDAAQILSMADLGRLYLFTTPIVLANCHYILRKYNSRKLIVQQLSRLMALLEIANIDKDIVLEALNSSFSDFEDALQNYSAIRSNLKIIITRNIRDYKNSKAVVLLPSEFLSSLKV